MASARQGLKRLAGTIGFLAVAVLLNTLVCADPAVAQCGSGPGAPDLGNTQCGTGALANNTSGTANSAFGFDALEANTMGYANTASGWGTLKDNTTGYNNTASGGYALEYNTTGYGNNANGYQALWHNTTGIRNTASGVYTLAHNTTGSYNIGLGSGAGMNIVAGSNNIDIGNAGSSNDTNTVRIGTQGTQTATFISGVSGILSGGSESTELAVNRTTGQVGVIPSSARFKRDIHDMGGASAGLMRLRPVSFRYKDDPSATLQYGLVAEEVARVYPNLVLRGTEGKVESVRYLEFTALLLNELQKQSHETRQLADALKQKDAAINALSERLAALEQQVRTANSARFDSLARK